MPVGPTGHSRGEPVVTSAAEEPSPLTWLNPPQWKMKPSSAMRHATFAVPLSDGTEADLGITVLGGAAGGLAANVNRWRTQLGLPELDSEDVAREGEEVVAGGITFTVFDLAGKPNGNSTRMLAAVTTFEGQSWFFKLTGSDAVSGQKPAFLTFLHSVQTR